MDFSNAGKWIILVGVILIVIGALVWLVGRTGWPLGRLPGDIRVERDGFSIYVPLATSILISLGLTILLNVILRLFRR